MVTLVSSGGRSSAKWIVAGVVVLLLASSVLAAKGALGNQTSVSTQQGRDSLLTLTPSSTSAHFIESAAAGGVAKLDSNGSGVIITPSNNLPDSGYYPKRTYISYDLSAQTGTLYTIFLFTSYQGKTLLFGGYQAFIHANSSSSIGTIIDFDNGELYNSTEPLVSLSSVLTEGQIAVIFVPLGSSSFISLRVESVQTTWGLLPFGSSGFLNESISDPETVAAVSYMLVLSIAIPVLLSLVLWRRVEGSWMTPRRTALLFVAAAAIRFALAPLTGFIDTDNFAATSSTYFSSGAFGIDWVSLPGFLYVELTSYLPYALLRDLGFTDWTVLAHSTFLVETLFVKIPSILADLGTGFLLAKFAERFRPSLKGSVLILYLFNPLTIYVSGVYGQFDTVFVFLVLATIYCHFVLDRPLLTGFILGVTSLVNPVGFILWIALVLFSQKARARSFIKAYSVGALAFLVGLAPLLSGSSSVLQTTLERLMSSYPGDNIVGASYNFLALGQLHSSSIGYGLTFRFLLELVGYSVGYYFYPVAASVAFLAFAILMFELHVRRKLSSILSFFAFTLGALALFELFFPTIFLQFALWPFALVLCAYAISNDGRYLSFAALLSLLTGVLYVLLVDKPIDRATGIGSELFADLRLVNAFWAMIGLVYSALMICIVILSINVIRRGHDVTTIEPQ
jgi:hypothetical protein